MHYIVTSSVTDFALYTDRCKSVCVCDMSASFRVWIVTGLKGYIHVPRVIKYIPSHPVFLYKLYVIMNAQNVSAYCKPSSGE
jgi:hypothetical protein